jgi:hypothetical protein
MGLAHAEPTVEIQPDARQNHPPAQHFSPPPRRSTACRQKSRHATTAAACVGSAGSGWYVAKLTSANVGGGLN